MTKLHLASGRYNSLTMKKRFLIETVLMACLFAFTAAQAGDKSMDQDTMDHGPNDARSGIEFTFGWPGDANKVDRTVPIKALDSMRYDKRELTVRAGETVRFTVTNAGKVRHEFVIGDAAEQREHEMEMQSMPGMVMPDEANGISLAPGETKSIVWQFAGPGPVELACHEAGHYAAGMVSRIIIEKK
jgi:uncharacterized cupredoxin-like copper-binding protein